VLTAEQFERARSLALQLAGIELMDRHHLLLGQRSRRAGIRDREGVEALLEAAEHGEPAATRRLLGLLTTKFTGFFRHPRHFDLAAAHALQMARERGRARLWSAGAATGEEAYSLAIALRETFPTDDPPVSILATDLDEEALTLARRGEYGESALRRLEAGRRQRFFLPNGAAGRWVIAPEVRRWVEFRALNLTDEVWPVEGPFDVIFCRNVLMYLNATHREAVVERLAARLAPDGLLILDPVEHLGAAGHRFTSSADGVHRFRGAAAAGRASVLTSPDSRKNGLDGSLALPKFAFPEP
jgi:chemotaxis protein methyltransferase CheR